MPRPLARTAAIVLLQLAVSSVHGQLYGRHLLIPTSNGVGENSLFADFQEIECALGDGLAPAARGATGYQCVHVEHPECVHSFDWDGSCREQEAKFAHTDGGRRAYVCGVRGVQKEILCCLSMATKLTNCRWQRVADIDDIKAAAPDTVVGDILFQQQSYDSRNILVETCQTAWAVEPDITARECDELRPTTPRPDEETTQIDCLALEGTARQECLRRERLKQWADPDTRGKKIAGIAVRSTGVLIARYLPRKIWP